MIAPYQTVCACGRTIPRGWPPDDSEARCDQCAKAAWVHQTQPELAFTRPSCSENWESLTPGNFDAERWSG